METNVFTQKEHEVMLKLVNPKEMLKLIEIEMLGCTHMQHLRNRYLLLERIGQKIQEQIKREQDVPA